MLVQRLKTKKPWFNQGFFQTQKWGKMSLFDTFSEEKII
tara:strand:- start:420 stop:536 length:117 start_codon:yes stop_codon:yes gene_type:complete